MTKQIKLPELFTKINDHFTITMCENGFLIDIGGQTSNDDWIDKKILISSTSDLHNAIDQIVVIPQRT